MVYTKKTWGASTRISAEALNHLETQYDEVLASSSTWNNHDSLYYTKGQAITRYFNPAFMGNGSGSDADLLDGHQASELVGTGLPVGSIVWWSKAVLPTGWYACDGGTYEGKYTTGNYSDRFVIGVSGTYTLGNKYGAASVTPTSYSVTIGGTVLDTTTMPAHSHTWSETHGTIVTYPFSGYSSYGQNGPFVYSNGSSTAARTTDAAGSSGSHTHAGSTVTFNSEANLPPYCALYLIQRVK